jgi:hypothetical protein
MFDLYKVPEFVIFLLLVLGVFVIVYAIALASLKGRKLSSTPEQGKVAVCSRGEIGLILSDRPVPVDYGNGQKGVAWTGLHLSPDKLGQPWSSRNPVVISKEVALQKLAALKAAQ